MLTDDDEDDDLTKVMKSLGLYEKPTTSSSMPQQIAKQSAQFESVFLPTVKRNIPPTNGLHQVTQQFNNTLLEELDELEDVNYSIKEFPERYRFLLELPAINDRELGQHPVSH